MEKLILTIQLHLIADIFMINRLCNECYKKTGEKFTVAFNGSKGYLSNVEISCEGKQTANNRIFVEQHFTEDGLDKNKTIELFYSRANGVRLNLI